MLRIKPKNYDFKIIKDDMNPGKHDGCFDVMRIFGKLAFLGGGEIYVPGKSFVFGDRYYVKKFVRYLDKALAVGYDFRKQEAGCFDGFCWAEKR